MSKTPRTDEHILHHANGNWHPSAFVLASFARQLETELADARAEIERKDKLIEQMLEALENIRDYPGHIDYTTGEVHSMQEIAIAALAAERGE